MIAVSSILTFFFAANHVAAQDIHFSQFYNSPLNLNPAYTGVFNGDQRFIGSFKDQWETVEVPWLTFAASYDRKFYPKRSDKYFFSGGLQFNYDRQGLSRLNLTNINLLGSYTRILNTNNLLTIGVLVGYATRGFSPGSLTWDRQWTGDLVDINLPSGETFDGERISFIETGVGLNYRWQSSKRTKLDIGAGAYHVLEPAVAFYNNDDITLPRRISANAVGQFKLAGALDIQLHALHQLQSDYRETVFGGLLKIHLNQQRGKELEVHVGGGYRTSESIIPVLAVQYRNLYVGFNYDIDISEFEIHTNNRGGPEVHVNYILTSVKPLKQFKVCPIF